MDAFQRTTKQIAAKYKQHLDYFRRPHYLRNAKIILFLFAVVGSLALVFSPHHPVLYSTGPISKAHERFADNCEKCHVGAKPNLLPNVTALVTGFKAEQAKAGAKRALLASNSLRELDQACNDCHKGFEYHQPQSLALGLRPVRTEMTGAEV